MHLLEDLSDEVVEGSIEECISMCLVMIRNLTIYKFRHCKSMMHQQG